MAKYLDTRGKWSLSVGICSRCRQKMPYADMYPDPNAPGIRGHLHCLDSFDPWRLPMRQPDQINLRFARPDVSLSVENEIGIITEDGIGFLITEDGASWLIP